MSLRIIVALSLLLSKYVSANEYDYLKDLDIKYTGDYSFQYENEIPTSKYVLKAPKISKLRDFLRIDPLLFLNMRREKQIINLAEQKVYDARVSQDDQIFKLDEVSSRGYLVSRQLDAIAGPFPIFKYAFSGIATILNLDSLPYFGLAPIKGYGRTEVRYVQEIEDAQNLRRLFIPSEKIEVGRMKVGESISFRTYGGMLLGAGASFFGIGVRAAVVKRGTWETTVQKIGDNKLLVAQLNINIDDENEQNVHNSDLDDLIVKNEPKKEKIYHFKGNKEYIVGIHAGNFASYRKTKSSEIRKSQSFLVDLNDEKAKDAYIQFVKGNTIAINDLAKDEKTESVIPYQAYVEYMEAELKRLRLSIPTLFKYIKTEGDIHTTRNENNHSTQKESLYEYTAYVDHLYKRAAANKQKNKTIAFIGSVNKVKNSDTKELIGNFIYDYSDNKAKTRVANRRIKEFVEFSGVKDANYQFPEKGNVGYFNFNSTITLSDKTTKFLMKMSTDDQIDETLSELSDKVVDAYVHHMREKEDKCQDFDKHDDKQLREQGVMQLDIHEGCLKRLKKRTRENMQNILTSLKKMNIANDAGKSEEFTQHYAEFGKLMLANNFNFQTILNIIKKHDAQIFLTFKGERISQVKKLIKWEEIK